MENNRNTGKRTRDSPTRQQTMKAYKPVPALSSTVAVFGLLGLTLIVIGCVIYSYTEDIIEVSSRYDDVGNCKSTHWTHPGQCEVVLDFPESSSETVYFYYELRNYHQNQRHYVKSKSVSQLAGEKLKKEELEDCHPIITYKNLGMPEKIPKGYTESDVAYPCGLIAQSVFNDTFSMYDPAGGTVEVSESDIAWESDKDFRFETIDGETPWIDVTDEHFIVWMRTAPLPNFRKLWGKITGGLKKGKHTVVVQSNYPVSEIDAEKHIFLSTTNSLGGNNTFLAFAYIIVGGLTTSLALVFFIRNWLCRKSLEVHP